MTWKIKDGRIVNERTVEHQVNPGDLPGYIIRLKNELANGRAYCEKLEAEIAEAEELARKIEAGEVQVKDPNKDVEVRKEPLPP